MIPMQLGTETELIVLRDSIVIGAAMGAVYDIFRVIRRLISRRVAEIICDFVYTLIFSFVFFIASLAMTDYLRGFILAGMLIGAAMWCASVGRASVFAVTAVLRGVGGIVRKIIIAPIAKICRCIAHKFRQSAVNLKKSEKHLKLSAQ